MTAARSTGVGCAAWSLPKLIETAGESDIDRMLVVDSPVELQIRRLLARDAENEPQARAMIAAQASRDQRLAVADDVIVNDSDRAALDVAVATLDAKYRALAAAEPSTRKP